MGLILLSTNGISGAQSLSTQGLGDISFRDRAA